MSLINLTLYKKTICLITKLFVCSIVKWFVKAFRIKVNPLYMLIPPKLTLLPLECRCTTLRLHDHF